VRKETRERGSERGRRRRVEGEGERERGMNIGGDGGEKGDCWLTAMDGMDELI